MENLIIWLKFSMSAGLVIFSGIKLTKCADILSDRFSINKAWMGMILLGAITSLPEATASIASAAVIRAPNLAIGNIAGSVNFNLMIVVLMDFMYHRGSVTGQIQVKRTYEWSAVFYGILSSIVVIEIFLSPKTNLITFGPVSLGSILIVIFYFLGSKFIFKKKVKDTDSRIKHVVSVQDKILIFKMVAGALVVIFSGIWLSGICDQISSITGLGQTFVGTTFLGFVTSLPEIVVSLSALRMGAFDLAFGNIFGSNMVNLLILAVSDLFYIKGPIFADVSQTHILMMTLSVVLTTILIVGIRKGVKKTFFGFGFDTILMMICFAVGMKFLYDLR
ncbi:MAG: hypothetical protein PHY73_01155 [Candidatus Omnitrophica bacterium]|nr:hypothetical protein [Candidatus Omnitrophota bacterium]